MPYPESFYADRATKGVPAARRVLRDLLQLLQPESVVDVGCGDGSFLSVLAEFGVDHLLGVEGVWIGDAQLAIAPELVRRHDLNEPFRCSRRFDLAVSIEVAEHLASERGAGFIDDLTRLADVVLFSAAIPGQGGTNHVNERWQSNWAGLFAARGYHVIDCLRPSLWSDDDVPHSWRQNLLLYANDRALQAWPALAAAKERRAGAILDFVHPRYFWRASKPRSLGHLLKSQLPRALGYSLRRRKGPLRDVSEPP